MPCETHANKIVITMHTIKFIHTASTQLGLCIHTHMHIHTQYIQGLIRCLLKSAEGLPLTSMGIGLGPHLAATMENVSVLYHSGYKFISLYSIYFTYLKMETVSYLTKWSKCCYILY